MFPSNCSRQVKPTDMCLSGGELSAQVHLETLCSCPDNVQYMCIVLEAGRVLFSRPVGVK